MKSFSHMDEKGYARMVDIGGKPTQHRRAKATGRIALKKATLDLIGEKKIEKGDVLTVAKIAGIQAAKRTAELIPLCHPIALNRVDIELKLTQTGVTAWSEASSTGRTGVEMEVLMAVSVALLTIYDMCKAVDSQMRIGDIHLLEKVKSDAEKD